MIQPDPMPIAPFLYEQPVIVAGLIALLGVIFANFVNYLLARRRIRFERDLAREKVRYDHALADWKRRVEFAEEALTEFYDIRSRLVSVRSPASYEGDNDDRVGRDQESDDLRRVRDMYYPVLRRFRAETDRFNAFYAKRHRATALFGPAALPPYEAVWGALASVSVAASMLVWRGNDELGGRGERLDEHRERLRTRVWEGLAEPDPVASEMDRAVALAEELFRPVIVNSPIS